MGSASTEADTRRFKLDQSFMGKKATSLTIKHIVLNTQMVRLMRDLTAHKNLAAHPRTTSVVNKVRDTFTSKKRPELRRCE